MGIEKLEIGLKELRTQSFLEEAFEGRSQYDEYLIEDLKRVVRSNEVISQFHTEPYDHRGKQVPVD